MGFNSAFKELNKKIQIVNGDKIKEIQDGISSIADVMLIPP